MSLSRIAKVAGSFLVFGVVSVLAGVLVAGLFVPAAGLAGVSGRAAASGFENLPAELETPPQAERSKVLLGNGEVLTYFYDQNRVYVPLAKIAPQMVRALLAIEDHRFYEHGAMDLTGTLRAFLRNSSGGSTQGGSTISQQYVKMVLVDSCNLDAECIAGVTEASGTEGYQRKIKELRYAIALEEKFSKDEILERYLNIAYFGDGAYGVEAAARHYFSTTAEKLSLSQGAMLAGLVQNPNQLNPVANPDAAAERRDVVVNRMAELNLISAKEATAAKKVVFDEDDVQRTRNGCIGSRYPFVCDYVRRTLLATPSLGKTVKEREQLLNRGGLTIETEIDPETQDIAEEQLADVVGPKDSVIATMNMIQPGTGLILAMAQSRPVMGNDSKAGETFYNYSATRAMGGAEGFQAGSTFKSFVAAAAFEQGIPMSKRYNAQPRMDFTGRRFESCNGTAKTDRFPVKNSTAARGVMDMRRAAEQSTNTYFIQLALQVGMCDVVKMVEKLGVESSAPTQPMSSFDTSPSLTIGTPEVAPMQMAEAYATFAARGVHCEATIVKKVTTVAGKALKVADGQCRQVIKPEVADAMNELLSGVMTKGTGTRARTDDNRPQAGKTGTTDNNATVSFAGYTPEVAGFAMIAIDNQKKPFIRGETPYRPKGVLGYRTDTGVRLEATGSGDAGGRIWKPTMERYLEGKPRTRFENPPRDLVQGSPEDVSELSGLTADQVEEQLTEQGLTVRRVFRYSDTVAQDQVISVQQSGSSVIIYVSAGPSPFGLGDPDDDDDGG